MGASFLTSLVALSDLLFLPAEERLGRVHVLYKWISAASFKLDFAILVDPLSVFMFLIVMTTSFYVVESHGDIRKNVTKTVSNHASLVW